MFKNQYKSAAWDKMKNNWLEPVLANLIISVLLAASSSVLYGLGNFVLYGVLSFGLSYFFLALMRNENVGIGDVFAGFKNNFVNSMLTGMLSSVSILLWSLLLVIPGIIKSYAYTMAFYVLNDNPEMSASEALTESERIMKGHKMEWFGIQLSFFGWALLSVITFGLAALWAVPYMEATKAAFYEDIKNN